MKYKKGRTASRITIDKNSSENETALLRHLFLGILFLLNGIYGLFSGRVMPDLFSNNFFVYKNESEVGYHLILILNLGIGLWLIRRHLAHYDGASHIAHGVFDEDEMEQSYFNDDMKNEKKVEISETRIYLVLMIIFLVLAGLATVFGF